MKIKMIAILACAVLVLTACSNVSVESDYEKGEDFSKFKTYQWRSPNEYNLASKTYLANDIIDKRIRETIDEQMKLKGMQLVANGSADFLVNYSVTTEPRVDVDTYNTYGGYAPGFYGGYGAGPYRYGSVGMGYGSTSTRVEHYTQGTLLVDVVDPTTDKLVWRGIAEGKLQKNKSQAEKDEAVQEVITRVLEDFPPQPK
jgi:hypothetical protein